MRQHILLNLAYFYEYSFENYEPNLRFFHWSMICWHPTNNSSHLYTLKNPPPAFQCMHTILAYNFCSADCHPFHADQHSMPGHSSSVGSLPCMLAAVRMICSSFSLRAVTSSVLNCRSALRKWPSCRHSSPRSASCCGNTRQLTT